MRHHAPHGLVTCSILFVLMALVTRGDAAIDDHFAHVRGETETQAIFTSVMQSMPAMAASGEKHNVARRHGCGHALRQKHFPSRERKHPPKQHAHCHRKRHDDT
eukprot:1299627-Pleurochrysis_carterae.AAC.1